MRLSLPRAGVAPIRRARPWLSAVSALALVGAGLGGVFLTTSTAGAAEHRSSCETGEAVGEICNYVDVVSQGPDYDIRGWLKNAQGGTIHEWHEKNPKYTHWWYRYDQESQPGSRMYISINLRDGSNRGLSADWPITEDRCFIVNTSRTIERRECPVGP